MSHAAAPKGWRWVVVKPSDDVFAWQLMNEPGGGSVYKPGDCNALADESGEGRCKSTLIVVLLGLVLVGEGGVGAGG